MHCSFEEGDSAFVLSIPHDGETVFPDKPKRREAEGWGCDRRDTETRAFGDRVRGCLGRAGSAPTIVAMGIHRAYLDVNRAPECEPYRDPSFADDYRRYHGLLHDALARAVEIRGMAILLDLHGYVRSPGPDVYDAVLGSDSHRTSPSGIDLLIHERLCVAGFSAVFSPSAARGISPRHRGGWIVRSAADRWHGKRVDACQVELPPHLREPTTCAGRQDPLARALADALLDAFRSFTRGR